MSIFNPNKNLKSQRDYQEHIASEKIFVTRLISALGVFMFITFFLVDLWAFVKIDYQTLIVVRSLVALTLLLTFSITFLTEFFEKYAELILPIPYLVAILGLNYIISLASSFDLASHTYFAGLMLVIMLLFSWSFLKIVVSLGICVFALSLYSYVITTNWLVSDNTLVAKLVIDLSLLLSAASIGIASQFFRDRHLVKSFLLQQSLKKAVEAKTIEAKDNAYLANHDPLTDLPNRRYVTELLEESLVTAKQEDKILAILFLDLNGFKQVNDVYGHNVGDEVLQIVAKRLEFAVREGDSLSRLAGDEFLVGLLMQKEGLSEVNKMSAKFTAMISKPMNIDGMSIKIGVSIGIAAYPMHGDKVNVLLNIADKKMYRIKKGVQNVVRDREQAGSEPVVIFPGNSRRR